MHIISAISVNGLASDIIEVPKVKTEELKVSKNYGKIETSKEIKKRVEKARFVQLEHFLGTHITFNSEMSIKEINKYCILDSETETILKQAVNAMNLSVRSYYRILKLARTIADLKIRERYKKRACFRGSQL